MDTEEQKHTFGQTLEEINNRISTVKDKSIYLSERIHSEILDKLENGANQEKIYQEINLIKYCVNEYLIDSKEKDNQPITISRSVYINEEKFQNIKNDIENEVKFKKPNKVIMSLLSIAQEGVLSHNGGPEVEARLEGVRYLLEQYTTNKNSLFYSKDNENSLSKKDEKTLFGKTIRELNEEIIEHPNKLEFIIEKIKNTERDFNGYYSFNKNEGLCKEAAKIQYWIDSYIEPTLESKGVLDNMSNVEHIAHTNDSLTIEELLKKSSELLQNINTPKNKVDEPKKKSLKP